MEAIILAGGLGTRLRKVIKDIPKVMAPLNGKPFLEYLLDNLSRKGFQRIVLSVGYKAKHIIDYFGTQYKNMALIYEIEKSPLGTGGAIRASLEKCIDDYVYIFNGDTYINLEVSAINTVLAQQNQPIIVVREVDNTNRYGSLIVQDNQVVRFSEKKGSGPGLINAGCYVFPKHLLDAFPVGKPFSIELDYFADAVNHVRFYAFTTKSIFIDMGIPEDYHRLLKLDISHRSL